ncbi:sigma-54-dependent transcriptional regulator [Tunicatimonas pelagia]|uniref:sigma-54-dependent transcriptional regulator n=1 Tax=Tunicatimonas pelagia TaxID=931531 RepID=UPI00266572FC|nr:sigma-54 dependent transcriptional regulator [Tunicatimonas pelagia]WKN42842.1 sigma-54 dependent transcriptional regulator [Tunicatimonas pelagia]
MIKIFCVEDDAVFSKALKLFLEREGNYDVSCFQSGEELFQNIHLNPDIITVDYNLPGMSGLETIQQIRNYNEHISVVVVSGQEEVRVTVEAYKNGAKYYVIKDETALTELALCIKNLTSHIELHKEVENLREQIIDRHRYDTIIGESSAILKVLKLIQKAEKSDILALITGESGTGKEVVARAMHYNSPRKKKPFVAVNAAAIPEDLIESELFGHEKGAFTGANSRRIGKFEEANGGTILLDEIGEMDASLQTKLLRVLQEKKVSRVGSNKEISLDVRVLAATNKDLAERVKEGLFREDLYYRLQGFLIHLPPLRDRENDSLLLAKHFLAETCQRNKLQPKHFTRAALESLLNHDWPGNIRELRSFVERAALMSDGEQIDTEDLVYSPSVI